MEPSKNHFRSSANSSLEGGMLMQNTYAQLDTLRLRPPRYMSGQSSQSSSLERR